MKIHQIAAHLGITARQLAELAGVSAQSLNNYTSGRRGAAGSEFVDRILAVAGLEREEIIFSNPFDMPDLNDTMPEYWLALALEAMQQAVERGLDQEKAREIAKAIHESCGDGARRYKSGLLWNRAVYE